MDIVIKPAPDNAPGTCRTMAKMFFNKAEYVKCVLQNDVAMLLFLLSKKKFDCWVYLSE